MNKHNYWMVIPSVLALTLTSASAALSAPVLRLTPGFAEPVTVSGTSGGSNPTRDCGNISPTPNHTIQMQRDFSYLRFNLQGNGQPTLLIKEPNGGRTCVSSDNFSGGNIELPGFWKQGVYEVYVGDRTGGSNPYTLSITQRAALTRINTPRL